MKVSLNGAICMAIEYFIEKGDLDGVARQPFYNVMYRKARSEKVDVGDYICRYLGIPKSKSGMKSNLYIKLLKAFFSDDLADEHLSSDLLNYIKAKGTSLDRLLENEGLTNTRSIPRALQSNEVMSIIKSYYNYKYSLNLISDLRGKLAKAQSLEDTDKVLEIMNCSGLIPNSINQLTVDGIDGAICLNEDTNQINELYGYDLYYKFNPHFYEDAFRSKGKPNSFINELSHALYADNIVCSNLPLSLAEMLINEFNSRGNLMRFFGSPNWLYFLFYYAVESGFSSIKDMLESQGIPVQSYCTDRVTYIQSIYPYIYARDNSSNTEQIYIQLDYIVYKYLHDNGLLQSLKISKKSGEIVVICDELNEVGRNQSKVLACEIGDGKYRDGNSLNIASSNIGYKM